MPEQRRTVTRVVTPPDPRRHRWLIGAIGALAASGLIFGGVGVPASAGDVNAGGDLRASAEVQGGCVTVAAGTGGADGSADPQQGPDAAGLQAAGRGTATVSVCGDDPGGSLPDDLDGVVPGDLDDAVPGDLDDAVPGDLDDVVPDEPGSSLKDEVVGVVTAALEGGLPGDGDGSLPGDPSDELPGGLGGLVEDGSGIDPGGLLDRVAQIIPEAIDGALPGGHSGGGPGGNSGGGAPAVNTSGSGSVSGSVAVAGAGAERSGGPTDVVLGAEVDRAAPTLVGPAPSPGTTLPRTGGGLGNGVLRLVAWLGIGRALLGLANRRRPAAGVGQD